MIVLSNGAAQTIQPGEAAELDRVTFRSGCGEAYYAGTGPARIRCGIYALEFTGNVGGAPATQPNLAIAVDGVPLRETTMAATTALDTDVFNVHASTRWRNCYGGATVTVVNTGTTPVTLAANPALVIERKG